MVLRLVHLEDDLNDRELVAATLRGDGIVCTVTTAASRTEFEAALAERPDLILSDFTLPGFDGISAQELAADRCPDVPFVFVSGSIGEDRAIERMKRGATDYVLKERLERLPAAVRRAIDEAKERRQRMDAERALRQLNAELEQRIDERTRMLKSSNEALAAAKQEAERANRAKSEFLSRMSHDLRTPLNAIMGFAQMLELDPLTHEQRESVAQILRGGKHLLNLINEVLDIARIEAGRMSVSMEPLCLADVVQNAIELVQPLAAQRGITVAVGVPAELNVRADRQRVVQILLNLLSNAVKYNSESGTIRVDAAATGGGRVSVAVADTGPGIPPDKVAKLFTPFERLGAESTGIEGTGLGLAVAKGLAGAMEGTLGVTSVVGQGSSFVLELPASAPADLAEAVMESALLQSPAREGRILYVEDNLPNVLLMQRLLSRRPGVKMQYTASGRKALDMIRAERPDLILLDAHLPDIPGEEILGTLQRSPDTRRIPVVVLSADATSGSQRDLLAAGAVKYLTKPFDVVEVLSVIDEALERRHTERNS